LTIVATFAGGMKIFNRMEGYTVAKADILLSMERMERDLKNTFQIKGIDFIGGAKKMTFPAILKTVSAKDRIDESIGSVSYYCDNGRDARILSREERAYAQAVEKEKAGHGDVLELTPIEDVDFQYFSYDPEAKTYSWVNEWDKSKEKEELKEKGKTSKVGAPLEDRLEELPLGVRIKIRYTDGDKTFSLNRTVFIRPAVSLNSAKRRAGEGKRDLEEAESEQ